MSKFRLKMSRLKGEQVASQFGFEALPIDPFKIAEDESIVVEAKKPDREGMSGCIVFNDDGVGNNRDLSGHQVGLAHFAFVVDDLDGVIARLAAIGHPVDKDGAEDPYRRNAYYIDPDGYEVEFVEYLSDVPSERNRY